MGLQLRKRFTIVMALNPTVPALLVVAVMWGNQIAIIIVPMAVPHTGANFIRIYDGNIIDSKFREISNI